MNAQPNTPPALPAHQLYERLLSLRVELGRQLYDAVCHNAEGQRDMLILFGRVLRLDAHLNRFGGRFDADYLDKVLPAEDRRLHLPPGERPSDEAEYPCGFCLREQLGLDADIVLLPSMRRPA